MRINTGSIGYLCIVWAFAILIGVSVGLNLPFALLVLATALYLVAWS